MPSKLDQLRAMSTVVADTGDMEFDPRLQADRRDHQSLPHPEGLADAGLRAARRGGHRLGRGRNRVTVGDVTDRVAVNFGAE